MSATMTYEKDAAAHTTAGKTSAESDEQTRVDGSQDLETYSSRNLDSEESSPPMAQFREGGMQGWLTILGGYIASSERLEYFTYIIIIGS
jgi:hypothetical protein